MTDNSFTLKQYDQKDNIVQKCILEIDKKITFDTLKSGMKIKDILTDNDRYKSYYVECKMNCVGTFITINNPEENELKKELDFTNVSLVKESYEQYLEKKRHLKKTNYEWIYNIVDHKSETEKIIYENDEFLLIPDYLWNNQKDVSKLHVLAIVKNKHIMSVRDLIQDDILMLDNMKVIGLKIISEKYGVDENKIKAYVHYTPSTYLFHVHFEHLLSFHRGTSFERSINLNDVIKNITLDKHYYKNTMEIVV